MNFENWETQKFYLDMCHKYKIQFIIYLNKDEIVTKAMIMQYVHSFLKIKSKETIICKEV